jgi:hypothetical protein
MNHGRPNRRQLLQMGRRLVEAVGISTPSALDYERHHDAS